MNQRILPVLLSLQFLLQAQQVSAQSTPVLSPGRPGAHRLDPARDRMPFDLSSSSRSSSLGDFISGQNVSITQNGVSTVLTSSTPLTSAQLLAALQVVNGGQQNLILDQAGRAIGGSVQFDGFLATKASSLLIPHGVTAIQDFAGGKALSLPGALINYGTIYGVSSNSAATTARFSALSIFNYSGAVLTTVLPPGGLSGMGALSHSLGLALSASSSIFNAGTISSAAGLTISSPLVTNSGTISALSNLTITAAQQMQNMAAANIISQQNLSILSPSVSNDSSIQSIHGNVSISSINSSLDLNNTGQIMAKLGKVDIHSLADLLASGGDYAARELSFQSQKGIVNLELNSIAGPVNLSGTCVSTSVKQGVLDVKSLKATDDPLLVNNVSDVLLPASLGGGPITVVAAGSIIGVATGSSIASSGGDIILLAGAANSTSGGVTTVSGPSSLPGDIKNIAGINAGGGNITIGSYQGKLTMRGGISTSSGQGKITVYVPGDISIASLRNPGNHAEGNCIEVVSASPDLGAGLTVASNGTLLSGTVGEGTAGAGSISVGAIDVSGSSGNGGGVKLIAGGSLNTGGINSSGLGGQGFGGSGFNAGPITLGAGAGGVSVDGNIYAYGGSGVHGLDFTSQDGGNGGNGGDLNIVSGGDVLLKQIFANGGGGAGGAGSGVKDAIAGKGGDGGSGGNISVSSSGRIVVSSINLTGGNGGGGGGGCCLGGRGGDGGTSGRTGSDGIQATAEGELLGKFSYGELTGGWYHGPGGGWPGYGGFGGGGGSGGWWGWEHGGAGGTGGSGGNVALVAAEGVRTAGIASFGGGSGGGGGFVASGGGGASNAAGGRSEDWIVHGDGPPGGAAGVYSGGGGGGGANHYFPGSPGGVSGGNGGDNFAGGPSGGGGSGGWGWGGAGGGFGPTGYGGNIELTSSNGSVEVNGDLSAFSFTKAAGSVVINSGNNIYISGQVRTDSGTKSGAITLNAGAVSGNVYVGSRLLSSSVAYQPSGSIQISAPSGSVQIGSLIPIMAQSNVVISTNGQSSAGGNLSISAQKMISINGAIVTGTGAVVMATSAVGAQAGYRSEPILIAGTIQASNVDIRAGSLRVLGGKNGISINSPKVFIQTFAVQPLPTYFDLSSSLQNTVALPGAVFIVGDSTANGTAGSVGSVNKVTITESSALETNNIKIQTVGSKVSITQDGSALQINALDANGARTLITPGQAIALFQVTRDSSALAQTVQLNALGQVVDGGTPGSPIFAKIALSSSDFNAQFSRFTLSTAGSGPVSISVSGDDSTLDLSAAALININGQINFTDPQANVKVLLGDKSLQLSFGGLISGFDSASVSFTGSGKGVWTNKGEISFGSIIFAGADKSVLNLDMGLSGKLSSPGINAGLLQVTAYDFVLTGGQIDNLIFNVIPAGKAVNSVTFASSLSPSALFGSLQAKTININSTGDFTVRAFDQIQASNVLQMKISGNLHIDGQVQAPDLTLSPMSDLIISTLAVVSSTNKINLLGKNVTIDGTITAPNVKLQNSNDLTTGTAASITGTTSLSITSGGSVYHSGSMSGLSVMLNPKGSVFLLPASQINSAKGSVSIRPQGELSLAGGITALSADLRPSTNLTIESSASISTKAYPVLNIPGNLIINANISAANPNFTAGKELTIGAAVTLTGTTSINLKSAGDLHLEGKLISPTQTLQSTKGALFVGDDAQLSSTGKITLISAQKIVVGSAASLDGKAGLSLSCTGVGNFAGVSIGENAQLKSLLGAVSINSSFPISVANGTNINAVSVSLTSKKDILLGTDNSGAALLINTSSNIYINSQTKIIANGPLNASSNAKLTIVATQQLSIDANSSITGLNGVAFNSTKGPMFIGENATITSSKGSVAFNSSSGSISITGGAKINGFGVIFASGSDLNLGSPSGAGTTINSSSSLLVNLAKGQIVDLGEGSTIMSNQGSLTLSAANGIKLGSSSILESKLSLRLAASNNAVSIGTASSLKSNTSSVIVSAKTLLTFSDEMQVSAAKGVNLKAVLDLTLGRDLRITNSASDVVLSSDKGNVSIGKHSEIQSGTLLAWADHAGRYKVSLPGGIQIRSGNKTIGIAAINIDSAISAGDQTSLRTAGGLLSVIASAGADVQIGDAASLESNGGNLAILSLGNIVGGTQLKLASNLAVNASGLTFTGGGMEIASGRTTLTAMSATTVLAKNPSVFTTVPSSPALGTVSVLNDPLSRGGLLKSDVSGLGSFINLSATTNASSINITGNIEKQGFGYLGIFVKGDGKSVQLDGSTFTVGKPIGFLQTQDEDGEELIPIAWSASPPQLSRGSGVCVSARASFGKNTLRTNSNDQIETQVKDGIWSSLREFGSKTESAWVMAASLPQMFTRDYDFYFKSGSALMLAARKLNLAMPGISVQLKPGALVHVQASKGSCSIKCLSGPGDVIVTAGKMSVSLSPGEEFGISQNKPEISSVGNSLVARRRVHMDKLDANRWYWNSDISILSLIDRHPDLKHIRSAQSADARKTRDSMLKTAAALQVVGSKYGSYLY